MHSMTSKITRDALYPLHHDKFKQYLYIIGLGLLASSMIYLIAANWFMLPTAVQLAIPQCLLLITASLSLFFYKNDLLVQSLQTISGLMIGLSLAVIGQVYQTGADSYLLFSLWSMLLLPWFYRRNLGVFVLFSIVSLLAILLGIEQTHLANIPYLPTAATSIWLLLLFAICIRYAPSLRYLFIAAFAIQTIAVLLHYFLRSNATFLWFCFVPIFILAAWFYYKKDHLSLTLIALIFGFAATAITLDVAVTGIRSDITQLLVCGIIVLIWFGVLTALLKHFFASSKFNIMPLAFGAWIAGLFFSSMLLLFWNTLSLIFGLFFMLIAGMILHKQTKNSIFIRQLSYCLFISGQVACLGHLAIELDSLLPSFILQIVITAVLFFLRAHWFFLMAQLLTAYGLAYILIVEHARDITVWFNLDPLAFIYVLNYLFFSLILLLPKIDAYYHRAVILVILASLVSSALGNQLFGIFNHPQDLYNSFALMLFPLGFFILFAYFYLKPQLSSLEIISFSILMALLIYFGYFEIFIILMILAWAINKQDYLIQSLSFICLIALLWHLYYSLDMSFLEKSFSIFISGIILFAIAKILEKSNILQESNA